MASRGWQGCWPRRFYKGLSIMAKGKRGKLKENFEGIHRNFTWAIEYCGRNLILIEDLKPELSKAIKALSKGIRTLDDLAQDIYSKL